MNLAAWNAGVALAFLAVAAWWRSDGKAWWASRDLLCEDCGRAKATCSCPGVVFEPWDEEDE